MSLPSSIHTVNTAPSMSAALMDIDSAGVSSFFGDDDDERLLDHEDDNTFQFSSIGTSGSFHVHRRRVPAARRSRPTIHRDAVQCLPVVPSLQDEEQQEDDALISKKQCISAHRRKTKTRHAFPVHDQNGAISKVLMEKLSDLQKKKGAESLIAVKLRGVVRRNEPQLDLSRMQISGTAGVPSSPKSLSTFSMKSGKSLSTFGRSSCKSPRSPSNGKASCKSPKTPLRAPKSPQKKLRGFLRRQDHFEFVPPAPDVTQTVSHVSAEAASPVSSLGSLSFHRLDISP